jgi:hypothetical protein
VVCPFPPNEVPKIENNALYCEMERSCPLQSAHPEGAKFPPNILISPINGSDMISLVCFTYSEAGLRIPRGFQKRPTLQSRLRLMLSVVTRSYR